MNKSAADSLNHRSLPILSIIYNTLHFIHLYLCICIYICIYIYMYSMYIFIHIMYVPRLMRNMCLRLSCQVCAYAHTYTQIT